MVMPGDDSAALVLFSGGQDSTVCLAWALSRHARVETVGFDYGQRHAIELESRQTIREALRSGWPEWKDRLGEDHMIALPELGRISETALTRDAEIRMMENGLPNTFVPGRNLLFFTYAAAVGYRRGIQTLVGGMCETDYSGYPDCRDRTLKVLNEAINLGMDQVFTMETPLMWLSKAETWALADELGGKPLVDLVVSETHSCYKGERGRRHDWGHGCGECPACRLRAEGYARWRESAARASA